MTAETALRVAVHFGIAGDSVIEIVPGGWVNDNLIVQTADGNWFVVRRYGRMHVTRRAVFFEHSVMRHAAERLRFVHAPLADAGGDSIYADGEGLFAVFGFAAGEVGDRSAAPAAADALGKFHVALDDFHPQHPRATRTVGALAWMRDRFLRFAAQPELARRLDWDALVVAVTRALTNVLAHAGRLPLAIVHGDPHPDNFVVRNRAVAALLDFDFTHETERVYDVASGADAFARGDEDAPLDLVEAHVFATMYDLRARLSDDEWALLPDLMIRRNAFLVWYVVSRHGQRAVGDIGKAERYAHRVAELDGFRDEWRQMPR